MKASDLIISFLEQHGVRTIFGYIGGAITHLVDSAYTHKNIDFIQVYHEQTAAIAAEGIGRTSDTIGVAMATSGPGATNLITGIADAYLDSVPVMYITGQVNTHEYKYTKKIRQQGFQETDIVSIVRPITKYAALVDDISMLKYHLEKALHEALSGRKGPVLLDIPMDIQRMDITPQTLKGFTPSARKTTPILKAATMTKVKALFARSTHPLLLVGGGVRLSGAEKEVLNFARRYQLPVVTSLMGKGCFPENDPLFIGMIGSYGNRCANLAIANTDLLITLGSRLDTRQTGTALGTFVRNGTIVHVDIDENEQKYHRLKNRLSVHADVKTFVRSFSTRVPVQDRSPWLSYIQDIKLTFSQEQEVLRNCPNKAPYELMSALNACVAPDQIYAVDIGQNQMFAAQALKITERQTFLTSGGLAPMGYALPLAIGVSFSDKKRKNIMAISGDGGLHIALQSLQLLSQYTLPIKVLVINNRSLGMITQFQDLYFHKKKCATTAESGYRVPDLQAIARAYALPYHKVTAQDIQRNTNKIRAILKKQGPALIECIVPDRTVVVPKLEVNKPLEMIAPELPASVLSKYILRSPVDEK